MSFSYEEVIQQVHGMNEVQINELLKSFHSSFTYQKIKDALSLTINDLSVGDLIFESDKIEMKTTNYPKFTVDVIVFEIARREQFPGIHYGLWVEEYTKLKGTDLNIEIDLVNTFLGSAKAYNVDNFDTILLYIEDGHLVYEALLDVIERASKKQEYYEKAVQLYEAWMLQFRLMLEVLEEQLLLAVISIYVKVNFKEAQRQVTRALDISEQKGEWILEYLTLVNKYQRQSLKTAFKRVQGYLVKSDEAYPEIMKLVSNI